jgi:aspartate kinase
MNMRVLKFGGTSVADETAIARVCAIVAAEARSAGHGAGPVVVVSALGGVTDQLLDAAAIARRGQGTEAAARIAALRDRHQRVLDAAAGAAADQARPFVEEQFAHLAAMVDAISVLRDATPRSFDAIAAMGEIVSSRIATAALVHAGLQAVVVDPRELIVTDDHFTSAAPQMETTGAQVRDRLRPLLAAGHVVVTGGFVGATRSGGTTTLGRGGSDYSAAILGAALEAIEIQIWTDVDGMLSADPRIVEYPLLVPALSFAEAAELAYFGAKVLHPKTIQPAAARNIPVRILNTFRPAGGTIIANTGAPDPPPVTALACKKGITVITITSSGMLMAHGYLRRIFEVFERFRTSVDVVSTSEVSVSVTIDDPANLDGIVAGLSAFADVSIVKDLALVAVVGEGYGADPGAFTRVVRALEGIPLRLVSQADARRNVTLVIDEDDLPRAMGQLHAEFFRSAPQPSTAASEVSA